MATTLFFLLFGIFVGQTYAQFAAPAGACGLRAPGRCFGTTYDVQAKQFCCDNHVFPCADPAKYACCGKMLVDRNLYICCSNDPFPKGDPANPMQCCEKNPIMPGTMACCEGEQVMMMGPMTRCCQKKPYDANTQLCCGKDIVLKTNAQYNLACTPGNNAPSLIVSPAQANSAAAPVDPPQAGSQPQPQPPNPVPQGPFNGGPPPPQGAVNGGPLQTQGAFNGPQNPFNPPPIFSFNGPPQGFNQPPNRNTNGPQPPQGSNGGLPLRGFQGQGPSPNANANANSNPNRNNGPLPPRLPQLPFQGPRLPPPNFNQGPPQLSLSNFNPGPPQLNGPQGQPQRPANVNQSPPRTNNQRPPSPPRSINPDIFQRLQQLRALLTRQGGIPM